VDNLFWVAVIFTLVLIGMITLWRGWRGMVLYLFMYGGLMLAWPYPNNRLISVTMPFLVTALLTGARAIASALPDMAYRIVLIALPVIMAAGTIERNIDRYELGAHCDRSKPLSQGNCYADQPRTGALVRAADYVRANALKGDIAVSSKAPSVYFLTSIRTEPSRTMRAYGLAVVDTLRARRIRFVILSRFFRADDGMLAEALLPRCSELRVEFAELPETLIVSPLPPGESAPGTCDAFREYKRGLEGID
jgi:hypothetical protein